MFMTSRSMYSARCKSPCRANRRDQPARLPHPGKPACWASTRHRISFNLPPLSITEIANFSHRRAGWLRSPHCLQARNCSSTCLCSRPIPCVHIKYGIGKQFNQNELNFFCNRIWGRLDIIMFAFMSRLSRAWWEKVFCTKGFSKYFSDPKISLVHEVGKDGGKLEKIKRRWLDKYVTDIVFQGKIKIILDIIGRYKHALRLRIFFANLPQELESFHDRHIDVRQNEVYGPLRKIIFRASMRFERRGLNILRPQDNPRSSRAFPACHRTTRSLCLFFLWSP